ncbi:uncharacterized protein METZ01_LOCUS239269, partial [marine metagenome]
MVREAFLGTSNFRTTVTEPLLELALGRGSPFPEMVIVSPGFEPGGTLILKSSASMCGIS